MIQTTAAERRTILKRLRKTLKEMGAAALVVPGTDPHQSEYPPDHWKVRHWLSGFDGSAGTLVITPDHAGLWTDGRYFLAAEEALDGRDWTLHRMGDPGVLSWDNWLLKNLPEESCVVLDSRLFSLKEILDLQTLLGAQNISVDTGFSVDTLGWDSRPSLQHHPVEDYPASLAGLTREEKAQQLRQTLSRQGASAALITPLDDVAWLLNIRGTDIPYNPFVISFVVLLPREIWFFAAPEQIPEALAADLAAAGVLIKDYRRWPALLGELTPDKIGQALYVTPARTGMAFCEALGEDIPVTTGPDLVESFKALKNETELGHLRDTMVADGAALVRVLRQINLYLAGKTPEGTPAVWTEMTVSDLLRAERAKSDGFRGESFSSIVGHGPRGAVIHYNPAHEEEPRPLLRENLLLIDSGGQYDRGTTDVTRTVPCGEVLPEQKRDYTLVLKGHIALSRAVFPEGTCGYQLDILARQFLWQEGLQYGHGTGHGVGFALSVHEGPQRISPHPLTVSLQEGMILSNEPGMYRTGQWGIRIENLVAVKRESQGEFGTFFSFETLTLAPYEQRLIDISLLSPEEIQWINDYHREVFRRLKSYLTEEEVLWLKEACAPLEG